MSSIAVDCYEIDRYCFAMFWWNNRSDRFTWHSWHSRLFLESVINIALVVSEASMLACTFTVAVPGLNWVLWPNSVVSPNWNQFKSIYWLLPVMTIVWWCCRTHPGAIVTHHHLPALAVHAGAKRCTGNLEAAPPAVRTIDAKTDWLTGRQASPCVPPEGGGERGRSVPYGGRTSAPTGPWMQHWHTLSGCSFTSLSCHLHNTEN